MNTTLDEGLTLAQSLRESLHDVRGAEVALLPPFTHLWPLHDALRGSDIQLGAQDVFWETAGAYTGEISPSMLIGCCTFALVGHSERRHLLGETDDQVGRKLTCALQAGLRVIVAVGETESERDAGNTHSVIARQLDAAFAPLTATPSHDSFVIAYEPVWAIGTGRTATPGQAEEACARIKERVIARLGIDSVGVLYGGSITAANAAALFAEQHIDGGLVGGASLRGDEFTAIVRAAAAATPA
jgi:triosephosphate isomerase